MGGGRGGMKCGGGGVGAEGAGVAHAMAGSGRGCTTVVSWRAVLSARGVMNCQGVGHLCSRGWLRRETDREQGGRQVAGADSPVCVGQHE